jgi:hypothetical protein
LEGLSRAGTLHGIDSATKESDVHDTPELNILFGLHALGGKARQAELSRKIGVKVAASSRRKVESKGLVGSSSGRNIELELTADGKAEVARLGQAPELLRGWKCPGPLVVMLSATAKMPRKPVKDPEAAYKGGLEETVWRQADEGIAHALQYASELRASLPPDCPRGLKVSALEVLNGVKRVASLRQLKSDADVGAIATFDPDRYIGAGIQLNRGQVGRVIQPAIVRGAGAELYTVKKGMLGN